MAKPSRLPIAMQGILDGRSQGAVKAKFRFAPRTRRGGLGQGMAHVHCYRHDGVGRTGGDSKGGDQGKAARVHGGRKAG